MPPRTAKTARLYSYHVRAFSYAKGAIDHDTVAMAAVVASNADEAIAEAQSLIDDGVERDEWRVTNADELMPQQAEEWRTYHLNSVSPRG